MGAMLDLDDVAAGHPLAMQQLQALRRWKSTHAPRLEALAGLLRTAQAEAHAGREAAATIASERAANAILTGELERLHAAENVSAPLSAIERNRAAEIVRHAAARHGLCCADCAALAELIEDFGDG